MWEGKRSEIRGFGGVTASAGTVARAGVRSLDKGNAFAMLLGWLPSFQLEPASYYKRINYNGNIVKFFKVL